MYVAMTSVLLIFLSGNWIDVSEAKAQSSSDIASDPCSRLVPLQEELNQERARLSVVGHELSPNETKRLADITSYKSSLEVLCTNHQVPVLLNGRSAKDWIKDLSDTNYAVRLNAGMKLSENSAMHSDLKSLATVLSNTGTQDSDDYVRHFARAALQSIQHAVQPLPQSPN